MGVSHAASANLMASAPTRAAVATAGASVDAAGLAAKTPITHPLGHSASARSCALSVRRMAMALTSVAAVIVEAMVDAAGPAVTAPTKPHLAPSALLALSRFR